MKPLRLIFAVALAFYMTGIGPMAFAQDTNSSPFSLTLAPVEYANVKGNAANFEALNWMPANSNMGGGVDNLSFTKDINKDISVDASGSFHPGVDDNTAEFTIKDADLAFFNIDYNAFRKYYDADGGTFPYAYTGTTNKIPTANQGVSPNTTNPMNLDISYFKMEAGLGPITDPDIDVIYEHDSKDGDKSLEQWASNYAYTTLGAISTNVVKTGPSWESLNDTVDKITVNEKKDIAGITLKGVQSAEVDYNHDLTYMQYISNNTTGTDSQEDTDSEYLDAKLFESGLRAEKWMLNDKTFAALGYHYDHIHDTDIMQSEVYYPELTNGVISMVPQSATGLNFAKASEDDHVWVANLDSELTKNLVLDADSRYEHMGSEGSSDYWASNTSSAYTIDQMENHNDDEGEHIALRYYGIEHTALYVEAEGDQKRDIDDQLSVSNTNTGFYDLNRLDSAKDGAWTVGGRIVPNRFFTFTSEVKQYWNNDEYRTLSTAGTISSSAIVLNALKENGVEESSTLTWKPYHWLQNSLKYQFSDNLYSPQPSTSGPTLAGNYDISNNRMLSSTFTYDINVQPTDALLVLFSVSHAENYVRTVQANASGTNYFPDFNSGYNTFLLSSSYDFSEYLSWTNTVSYTFAPNYVDFSSGIPLGSDFKMANVSTEVDYKFHKWLKIGPRYEYASYRENGSDGEGNYSANIFLLTIGCDW